MESITSRITTEDLKQYYQIAASLWADHDRAHAQARRTLEAISMQENDPETFSLKAIQALYLRSVATQTTAPLNALNKPFYRLGAEARLALVALHQLRASYKKVSLILGIPQDQLERLAWKTRLSLSIQTQIGTSYAVGSKRSGVSCPEYVQDRPWTQKFLDDEFRGSERLFLQNHLMVCESCRKALNSCRDIYYSVERSLPQMMGLEAICQDGMQVIRQAQNQGFQTKHSATRSLLRFARRPSTIAALVLLVAILLVKNQSVFFLVAHN